MRRFISAIWSGKSAQDTADYGRMRELAEYGMTRVLILVLVTVLVILIQSRIMVMLTAASEGLSVS